MGANLTGVDGDGATLIRTNLMSSTNLTGSTWKGATLTAVQFYFTTCPDGWRATNSSQNQSCVGHGM